MTFLALRKVLTSRGYVRKKVVSAGLLRYKCFLSTALRLCEGGIAWLLNVIISVHNMQNYGSVFLFFLQNNPHWYQRR